MRIVDRYIGRSIIGAALTVLFVLVAIFTFFAFIDELEDVGRGVYTLTKAAGVVLLQLPGLAYELLPIAALLGALLALGSLAERGELAVVRAAGVSKGRLIRSVMKAGLLLTLGAALVGEVVYPGSERLSRSQRSAAIEDRVGSVTKHGFWARDGRSFVNIKGLAEHDRYRNIDIFEFDDGRELRVASHAEEARYIDGQWQLLELTQTRFEPDGVTTLKLPKASWSSVLDPELIGMVALKPEILSIYELARYVRFGKENGQNVQRWEHALWTKLTYPFAAAVMVYLACPLVMRAGRNISVGRRVTLGTLIGLAFHIANQASGHLGTVFGITPALSALGPTMVIFVLSAFLMRRQA
jgi:lipopolysaccharide export system permease protein